MHTYVRTSVHRYIGTYVHVLCDVWTRIVGVEKKKEVFVRILLNSTESHLRVHL